MICIREGGGPTLCCPAAKSTSKFCANQVHISHHGNGPVTQALDSPHSHGMCLASRELDAGTTLLAWPLSPGCLIGSLSGERGLGHLDARLSSRQA